MKGQEISLRQARHHLSIYLFILPCVFSVGIFMYYPVVNGIYHSVFDWNGGDIERFDGIRNYTRLITENVTFWRAFSNALILGVANVAKMLPAIVTAVCLNRVRNERLQYFYRVCFVVPMVIPALVTVLLWKSIFDPATGALNTILNATGGMKMLVWTSRASAALGSLKFGPSVWILAPLPGALGAVLVGAVANGARGSGAALCGFLLGLCGLAGCWWMHAATGSVAGSIAGALLGAGVLGVLLKSPRSPGWAHRLEGCATLKRNGILTLLGLTIGTAGMSYIVPWTGNSLQHVGGLFIEGQNPAWLGTENMAFIAMVVWGFPWVASLNVLVYLACLQTIGKEIYEAAEVDGAGWFAKFRHIELPFILRQVRVMMVLVIMGSLNDVTMVMMLFGIEGGPGGVMQMPALFMFREAFYSQAMGSACAIGVVLFTVIVVMTKLNERLMKSQDSF